MPWGEPVTPPSAVRLSTPPEDCTCVWTIAYLDNGGRSGSVHIAGQPCPAMPHPRRFTQEAPDAR